MFSKIIIGCCVLFCLCAGCVPKPSIHPEGEVVAVWDLENLSPTASTFPDVGELLSAKVIETLKETGEVTVVERERLLLLLNELNLGSSDLVDQTTRLKLGRTVGARMMVFGSYLVVDDTMRLDLRLVDVETGAILKASEKIATGQNVTGWVKAAGEAAKELL